MSSIKGEWKRVLMTLLSPWTLVSLLVLGGVILAKIQLEANAVVRIVVDIALAVSSGVVCAVVVQKYRDLSGQSIIQVRSKSAIRALKILLDGIVRLKKSLIASIYVTSETDNEDEDNDQLLNLSAAAYSTCIDNSDFLQSMVIGAIEEWQELIGGEPISALLDYFQTHLSEINDLNKEISEKDRKILTLEDDKHQDREKLEDQIEEKRQAIENLRDQLTKKSKQIDTGVFSGLYGTAKRDYKDSYKQYGTVKNSISHRVSISCPRCGSLMDEYDNQYRCPKCNYFEMD